MGWSSNWHGPNYRPGQRRDALLGHVPDHLRAIDIWIGEPNYLGLGLGTKIMQLAIERCFASPEVEGILVDPLSNNGRAIRFYERLGFQFVEHRQFEDDHCAIYRLSPNV